VKKNIGFLFIIFLFLISCGIREKGKLYVYNWSYYTPESIIEKFEKENKVKIILDEFSSNEELFAKLISSGTAGYDVIFPSADYVSIMMSQGMLEKLDITKMPNLKNIDPVLRAKMIYDINMDYSVPYYWGAAGVIVNTSRVSFFEKNISIFGREDLRGRMTMLDEMRDVIGAALVFLGYSVNSKNPDEIKMAADLINSKWKPNLVKFDSSSFGKGYANGDFWVVQAFAEVVYEEIADNPQLLKDTIFFIPPGGSSYIDVMCIPRGAKNTELACKFIDFIHRPEIYAEFCDEFNFPSTVNVAARQYKQGPSLYQIEDLIDTEIQADLGNALDYYTSEWFNTIRIGK